jgi:hypothetical protein
MHSTKKILIYIFFVFSAAEVQAPDETKIPRVAIVTIGKRVPQDGHSSFLNNDAPSVARKTYKSSVIFI